MATEPRCQCPDCLDDEEAGCAVTMYAAPGGELVQCGLPGGHEGSCDYWERPHKARWPWLGTNYNTPPTGSELDTRAMRHPW